MKESLKIKQRESYKYIGKKVKVKIDRPLNSRHPKHQFIYPINYGYVPNTISGDGEEPEKEKIYEIYIKRASNDQRK